MTIGRAQANSAQSSGLAYSSAVTVGSLLVAAVNTISNAVQATISAVSDSVNGSWTKAVSVQYLTSGWMGEVSIWYRANTGAGTPTVTASTNSSFNPCLSLGEYTGMPTTATLDGTATTTGNTASTSHTTGNATTTTADLLLGGAGDWGDNDVYTAGSGWTKATALVSGNIQSMLEDQGVGTTGAAAGTYAASYTTAVSSNAAGVFAAFNAGAAATPPPANPVVAPSLAAIQSSTW